MEEAHIIREPKGGPDVIFVGGTADQKRMLLAGDYLSVRGFTARVVTLPDGILAFAALSGSEQARVLSGDAPALFLLENPTLAAADAATIAASAIQEMQK